MRSRRQKEAQVVLGAEALFSLLLSSHSCALWEEILKVLGVSVKSETCAIETCSVAL